MSYQQTYTCDQCGKQKEASNHWWLVFISTNSGGLTVFPWNPDTALNSRVKHLCGEGCTAKLMSKWMSNT